jgi:hypothetical protein
VCNYVFAYDATSAEREHRGGGNVGTIVFVVAAVALAAAYFWAAGWPGLAEHRGVGLLMVGAGAFSVAGAYANWSWFFGMRRARPFVAILGRTGARILYAAIGGGLIGSGVAMAMV